MPGQMEITPFHWAGFIVIVLVFLSLDLGVFHRHAHVVTFKEALAWTTIWFVLCGLTAMLAHGLFDAVTWGTKPAFMVWALLGLLVASGSLVTRPNSAIRSSTTITRHIP